MGGGGGRGHLRGSRRSVRDCLDLRRLELSRHKSHFLGREREAGVEEGRCL